MRAKFTTLAFAVCAMVATGLFAGQYVVQASDHDDGEVDLKGRSLNITDLYVFREDNQTGRGADKGNLILIMNTNPRSLPGQQYFFSTTAQYDFHLTQVATADKTKKPTGSDDVVLRFQFSTPTADGKQQITFNFIKNGRTTLIDKTASGSAILTTPLAASQGNAPVLNTVNINGVPATIFAGLREDPFFFDVEQFFKVREEALKTRRFIGFLAAAQAKDFTHNYNVNAIVVRIPISALQGAATHTIFDTWTTISVPKGVVR